MYLSRMLYNHTQHGDALTRALVFTIQVNHLKNSKSVKKAIFQKVHRALYGELSSPDQFDFSLFIVSDVEGSRSGYIPNEVLLNPVVPHYHGVMVFTEADWINIDGNLAYWKGVIRSSISDIIEVKDNEIDNDGCIKSEAVWLDVFQEKNLKSAKHKSPLGDFIQYSMKSHLQGVNRGILLHEPSVFPFDIHASEQDVGGANRLFDELWGQQDEFNKSHKYTY